MKQKEKWKKIDYHEDWEISTLGNVRRYKNGEYISIKPSVNSAAEEENIIPTSISNNLNGRSKTCGAKKLKFTYEK